MSKKDVLLKELKQLEKERGFLDAKDVVKMAENPKSVLHGYFEWNDKHAGEEFRLWQARELIRTVTIEYKGHQVNAYWNAKVQIGEEKTQRYYPIERVLSDDEMRVSILEIMLLDIRNIQKKYKELKETSEIINEKAVTRISKRLGK